MLPSTMPITLAGRRPSRRFRVARLALAALALLGSMPGVLSPSAAQAAPPPPVPPPVLVPIPFPPRDLQVEDIEITQSQQYLNNATYADNSLPGVDRRTTTVRVTVKVSGWLPLPVSNVQGRL
jgi:hypothetical protein